MKRITLATLTLLFACTVEARERLFEPEASTGQEIRFVEGVSQLIARGEHGGAVVSFEPESKKRGWITVFVANLGGTPINVRETDFSATQADGKPLHVYSYAELQKQQARSEMWGAVAAGLAAGARSMSAANAGYSNHYGSYQGTTQAQAWGSGGYVSGTAYTNGTYFGSSYNAGAAFQAQQQANAQNSADAQRMLASNALNRETLESRTLKATTIDPGSNVVGQVKVDLPKARRGDIASFTLLIPVGTETFAVRFVERKD